MLVPIRERDTSIGLGGPKENLRARDSKVLLKKYMVVWYKSL